MISKQNNFDKGEIAIYKSKDNKIQLEVKLEKDTVWLTQKQIAWLFGTQRPAITKHLGNIFKNRELQENSVCSILEHTAADGKTYRTQYYNLDAIISIGYRVNSKRATQFRIWATQILRKHIVDGYTLNEKRLLTQRQKLEKLENTLKLIHKTKGRNKLDYKETAGLLDIINDYYFALELLSDYDNKKLKITDVSKKAKYKLTYKDAQNIIIRLQKKFSASRLFGRVKDGSFKSSILTIYQTFGGKELYPSVEEKAANLLYFLVKNHSFVDGNKRIAAAVFLWFLEKNGLLYRADGSQRIACNALVAMTLMIAESEPKDREIIIALIVNLINKKN